MRARTTEGIILELRRDPRGALDLPGVENVLIGIHVGAPAKLACRRGGKRYSGTAVHGTLKSFLRTRQANGKCRMRMTRLYS